MDDTIRIILTVLMGTLSITYLYFAYSFNKMSKEIRKEIDSLTK